MTYNANDFAVHAEREVKDDGTVVNASNGLDTDGIRFVKDKANNPVIIATIPYTSFTANNTFSSIFNGVLSPNAKRRIFTIVNGLNVGGTNLSIFPFDHAAKAITGSSVNDSWFHGYGDNMKITSISPLGYDSFSGSSYTALNAPADSLMFQLSIGATAATSGNLYIVVREIF
jgi:hypothetical protein